MGMFEGRSRSRTVSHAANTCVKAKIGFCFVWIGLTAAVSRNIAEFIPQPLLRFNKIIAKKNGKMNADAGSRNREPRPGPDC